MTPTPTHRSATFLCQDSKCWRLCLMRSDRVCLAKLETWQNLSQDASAELQQGAQSQQTLLHLQHQEQQMQVNMQSVQQAMHTFFLLYAWAVWLVTTVLRESPWAHEKAPMAMASVWASRWQIKGNLNSTYLNVMLGLHLLPEQFQCNLALVPRTLLTSYHALWDLWKCWAGSKSVSYSGFPFIGPLSVVVLHNVPILEKYCNTLPLKTTSCHILLLWVLIGWQCFLWVGLMWDSRVVCVRCSASISYRHSEQIHCFFFSNIHTAVLWQIASRLWIVDKVDQSCLCPQTEVKQVCFTVWHINFFSLFKFEKTIKGKH